WVAWATSKSRYARHFTERGACGAPRFTFLRCWSIQEAAHSDRLRIITVRLPLKSISFAALLALAAPTVLSGCGAQPADAAEILSAAPEKTTAATSAKFTIDETVDAAGKSMHLSMDGALDLKTNNGEVNLDASAFGIPGLNKTLSVRPRRRRDVHGPV